MRKMRVREMPVNSTFKGVMGCVLKVIKNEENEVLAKCERHGHIHKYRDEERELISIPEVDDCK